MSIADIPEKVRSLLWAKTAGRCEYNGCNEALWMDGLTKLEMNFADVAHIIGDRPEGPRGHEVLSPQYCSDISNLMLMCLNHHRMIDEILQNHSDEELRQMKNAHEERIERLTSIRPERTSHVLIYRGSIGQHQPKIDFQDAWAAMAPSWYPSSRLPIELGLTRSTLRDHENDFWHVEERNLERQFNANVKPLIDSDREANHVSVFAFAPQPLLVKLGALLSDIYPAEIYQPHREPQTWEWQPSPEGFDYVVEEPSLHRGTVALNLSLSAAISRERIRRGLDGDEFSEWKMTIANPQNDYLQSRGQLQMFRTVLRQLLNRIKAEHGEGAVVHLFPAVPASVAVEVGRVWQSKADLPMVIYDHNRKSGGFSRSFNIGDLTND